jgi:hypothetical protein
VNPISQPLVFRIVICDLGLSSCLCPFCTQEDHCIFLP